MAHKEVEVTAEDINRYFERGAVKVNLRFDIYTAATYLMVMDKNGQTLMHLELDAESWANALQSMHLAEIPF